jgi:hypothetical protein
LKAFGWEVDFLDEHKAEEVSRDLNNAIDMFKLRVREHYDRAAREVSLCESLSATANSFMTALIATVSIATTSSEAWRSTLHMPHAFLAQHYLQVCRYVGPAAQLSEVGRAFPNRWGVVGLTFRLSEPQVVSSTSADPRELAREWGLTREEALARASNQNYSYITTPVWYKGAIVGVLFVEFKNRVDDTGAVPAFQESDADGVQQALQAFLNSTTGEALASRLAHVHEHVSSAEPRLRPVDDLPD